MNGHDPDELFELAVEAGAEDVVFGEDTIEVFSGVHEFQVLQEALSGASIEMDVAEVSMFPQTTMDLDADKGLKVMGLVDELEELDDVEKVFSNLNISDELVELYSAQA